MEYTSYTARVSVLASRISVLSRGAFDSAKNHKRQRHKRQLVTVKREKSQVRIG